MEPGADQRDRLGAGDRHFLRYCQPDRAAGSWSGHDQSDLCEPSFNPPGCGRNICDRFPNWLFQRAHPYTNALGRHPPNPAEPHPNDIALSGLWIPAGATLGCGPLPKPGFVHGRIIRDDVPGSQHRSGLCRVA